ncbi:MAG: MBL fold metallo-hydrolase [Pseudomonadota bacterium]
MTEFPTRRATLGGLAAAAALPAVSQAAAPMLGASRPVVNRVKLGGFEVTTIFDGAITLDGPHPIFGENAEAAAVEALAAENNLPPKTMEIGFTPVVVNTGEQLILFDAGNGAGRRPNAGHLRERLAEAGYTPDQIDVVVITHMHPDHIGGLMEDGSPAFPNASYVTSSAEYDFWSPEERMSGPTERVATLVDSNVKPLAEKFSFIAPGDSVASGIEAVDASGHTPGHTAYHIESEGQRLLLIADLANHFVVSMQRPDWHVRFDMDKEKAVAARKRILGMIAADGIPFAGYHMPFPAVGFLEAEGEGFRYSAAAYQFAVSG